MIKWFKDIEDSDFNLVGAKGTNLAKMYSRGVQVPDGFVILSSAYEAYVSDNDLTAIIEGLLTSALPVATQSVSIQKLFTADKVKPELKQVLKNAFQDIDSGRVAVRSSSTAEDLPGISFAGQYSSFLNVTENTLLEKIVACWRSLWNVEAMVYRERYRINEGFSHGVVVQEMVEAAVAGVAFTANPLNGIRNQLVVNASWGLGEAVVNGEVNPDQYVVDRLSGDVIDRRLNKKAIKYIYSEEGIHKVDVEKAMYGQACMTDGYLMMLKLAADKIEDFFCKPQDIEFAFDASGQLFILQSRDVTTLYPIDNLMQDGKLRPYMSASTVLLGVREPFTPLGYDLMSHMFPTIINVMTARKKKPLSNSFVSYAGGRIYVDMSYLMSSKFIAKQFAGAFSGNDLPLKGVMNQVIADYGKTLRHQGIHFKMPMGFIKYGVSMAAGMGKIIRIPNGQRYDAMKSIGNRWFKAIKKDYDRADTNEERMDFALKALVQAFKLSQVQATYCLDANNYIKIEKVLKKHFGDTYKVETLVQSLPGCVTQTMTMDLNRYAADCAERGTRPSVDDLSFKAILDKYGHRANIELDFGTERWRESPAYLLGIVESFMEKGMYERNLNDHKQKAQEAFEMIDEITENLKKKIGLRKAMKFKKYLINYRYGAAMREYPKSDIVRFLELARKSVQVIGERLVAEGQLEHKNDVFFLRKDQLFVEGDYKALVLEAKAAYKKEMQRKAIPRILMNNGHTYYNAVETDPNADVLQGQPLSAGLYEGRIRIVHDPLKSNLEEGDIMVAETTNPAWTPLFATAGALIMEYGGPMSHGGIVAREYGIPCVVGISSASERLKDGQKVRVNGETGIVELL